MKKLFLFAALALFAFNVNAQDEDNDSNGYGWSKGDIYISGSVGIMSTSFGDAKDNGFTFMPQVGFLVSDNVAIGGQLGFMSNNSEDTGGNTVSESNTFMVGAYGKYLFTPEDRFTTYLGAGLNYMSEKDKISDVTYDGFEIGAGWGLVYGLNDNFFIGANHTLLSYSTFKSDIDGAESVNTFNLGLDWKSLNFSLGYKF